MIAAAIIIGVLVLISLLRFGADAEYGSDGLRVSAQIGLFSIQIYPGKPKVRKREKKPKKERMPGKAKSLNDMLPGIKKALSRLRRRLLIKKLTIHYTAGGDDAFKTAMSYGAANAAFGMIVPLLENSFRIKSRDLRASADFVTGVPCIYVNAAFSLAVWEAVYIVMGAASIILNKSDGKEVKRHGKASDRRSNGDNNAENQGND